MLKPLPFSVDPIRLATRGQFLAGHLPIASMQRLAPSLMHTEGEALVELSFATDKNAVNRSIPIIKGQIVATLEVQCQRCLEALVLQQEIGVSLAIVRNISEADKLTGEYEPLLLVEQELLLAELVEDELIMSLPAITKHAAGQCASEIEQYCKKPNEYQTEKVGNKPLAILGDLLKK